MEDDIQSMIKYASNIPKLPAARSDWKLFAEQRLPKISPGAWYSRYSKNRELIDREAKKLRNISVSKGSSTSPLLPRSLKRSPSVELIPAPKRSRTEQTGSPTPFQDPSHNDHLQELTQQPPDSTSQSYTFGILSRWVLERMTDRGYSRISGVPSEDVLDQISVACLLVSEGSDPRMSAWKTFAQRVRS